MDARRTSKQELLSRRARYMILEACHCQSRMNIRYGPGYPDLDDRFPSGYLDSMTRRDKFGDARRRYSKKRRCKSRIWIKRSGKCSFTAFLRLSRWGFAGGWPKFDFYSFLGVLCRRKRTEKIAQVVVILQVASQEFQTTLCNHSALAVPRYI